MTENPKEEIVGGQGNPLARKAHTWHLVDETEEDSVPMIGSDGEEFLRLASPVYGQMKAEEESFKRLLRIK